MKGIPSDDIIDFLEGSFGAFQHKQSAPNWSWDRARFADALKNLAVHKLIETTDGGLYQLTELGRFAGEGGVEVESIVRLVESLSRLAPESISDPTLIAATQLTVELDQVYFPMNKKSTQKEPQTWFGELGRQGIAAHVLNSLKHFASEQHTGTLRAKKAVSCLLWISDRPMSEIEKALTQHGGAFDGAAGPIRSVSSRTCDLLPAVATVATILHAGLDLVSRVNRLQTRLEVGVPAAAVEIAQHAGSRLSRGDYHQLIKAGLGTAAAVETAEDAKLIAALSGNTERAEAVRAAARMFRDQAGSPVSPILPEYEA